MDFWGHTHPGEANGPRQWVKPKLFDAFRQSFWGLASKSQGGAGRGKKSIEGSKKGLCKGLLIYPTAELPGHFPR